MVYSFYITSLPSHCALPKLHPINIRCNSRRLFSPIIKAQGFRDHDQGSRSNNSIVDANLSVLRERMEVIKVKERLEKYCRGDDIYGWNYDADSKRRPGLRSNQSPTMEFLELSGIICGTLGFTFLSGTFFIYLVSLLVHLKQSL